MSSKKPLVIFFELKNFEIKINSHTWNPTWYTNWYNYNAIQITDKILYY